jgi:tRNA dimethylallyltransferase
MKKVEQPPVVVVVGQTASGKSDLAMGCAQTFAGEIICADSRTIYRELTIGAAKPSLVDRKLVRHHMLDVLEADQFMGATAFREQARAAVSDIAGRGGLSFVVGGTRLFAETMIFDLQYQPLSARERTRLQKLDVAALHAEMKERGINLPLNYCDREQLLQALDENYVRPQPRPQREHTLVLATPLVTVSQVRARTLARLEQMLGMGLEVEVRTLARKYQRLASSFNSIGYREWQPYLEGKQSMYQVEKEIIDNTIGYAQQQRQWLLELEQQCQLQWVRSRKEAEDLVRAWL